MRNQLFASQLPGGLADGLPHLHDGYMSDRYIDHTQAFFGDRAATWDAKFGDDLPAYAAAVAQARLRPGGVVADVGGGTGRALPALRAAVGPAGLVIGLDLTPQMLHHARLHRRHE